MITLISRSLLVAALLFSAAATAEPQIPPLNGRVVDAAHILSDAAEAQLTQKLATHEANTSNQLVVLTVPDLQGYDVASFALEAARSWQLGQQELNNGILLLVARDERKIRIEVGYGLEGDLPDASAKRIIQSLIRPAFKQGNFDQGVSDGVDAIVGTIDGSYTPPKKTSSKMDTPLIPLGFMGLFGLGHFLQGRVDSKYINGLVGGGFGGTITALITQKWYVGLIAALVLAFFFSRSSSANRSGANGHGHYGGRGGLGRRGGFGGGGGGFGGGGASGGW